MKIAPEKTITLFDTPMHTLSLQDTLRVIQGRLEDGQFTQHVVVNVAKLVNVQHDEKLKESVECCDLINIDGMGVIWGGRFLGYDIPERVAGVDLFLELINLSARQSYPIYLLGATADVVESVAKKLKREHPRLKIAGYHHGYFWDDEKAVVDEIRNSGARLLFVAITSPKKENFIHQWKDELGVDFVMGVGGTFDVVAGRVKRAPLWMQQYGLEWFYRVFQEPRRMWKRYLVTNLTFAVMVLKAKIRSR